MKEKKLVKNISVIYSGSQKELFQGTESELKQKLQEGWKVVPNQGGNGSEWIQKDAAVYASFDCNKTSQALEIKDLIKDYYNLKQIREARAYKFQDEVNSGKIKLYYDEETNELSF